MTCIAAIVDNKGVGYIACDSLGSNHYTKNTYTNRKIFKVSDMLIGFTGSYRMGQILQYRLNMPAAAVGQTLEEWLHINFLDAVRDVFKENGFLRVTENQEQPADGEFLIVVAGRIFIMQADLSILESEDGFEACGSGEDYARATMNAAVTHGITKPKRILTEAIEAASKYVPSVGGEIHILSEKA